MEAGQAGADHGIRAPAPGGVGQLAAQHGVDLGGRHAAAGQNAGALDAGGRAGDDDVIHAPIRTGLEQKGHVEYDAGMAGGTGAGQKASLGRADHGVNNVLEASKSRRVGEGRTEPATVEDALGDGAGKGSGDGGECGAAGALEAMDGGVGVEHRDVPAPTLGCDGALAHADPAGEADHAHGPVMGNRLSGADCAIGACVDSRRGPEPGGEARYGLMQEHADCRDRDQSAGGRGCTTGHPIRPAAGACPMIVMVWLSIIITATAR